MERVPFELPDDQCERLKRSEMVLLRMIMALISEVHYAKEDLTDRLRMIPDGTERMDELIENADALFKDILGTVSDRQRKQLRNAAQDFNVTLQPKMTPGLNKVVMSSDEMQDIVDCAREKCKFCTDSGAEAKNCQLYRWLEVNVPLDDYADDLMCPYADLDWR